MKIFLRDIKERFPEFEIRNYDENASFTAFNHDSRTIKAGELFLPIVGETFDGHDFIIQALKDGASMALCESRKSLLVKDSTKPVILVDSIEEGSQKILNYFMTFISAPTVAITGSTGKTTTRQMLVSILEEEGSVLSSDKYNTVWGNAVLLSEYTNEKYVVLECGMDREGEIAWHANSFDPDIGAILNIGYVHAEKLGSIENIYKEKKNLADYLNKMGRPLILNTDDERLTKITDEYKAKLVTYGIDEYSKFRISDIVINPSGTDYILNINSNQYPVHINAFGDGLVYDATAAIAMANTMGVDIEKCIENLLKFVPHSGRFEVISLEDGNYIINDAYNANPVSMKMSLETFDKLYSKNDFKRIVILGDMKELGDVSSQKHNELGELVNKMRFDEVYFLGDYFNDFGVGEEIKSIPEAVSIIKDNLEKEKKRLAILCKGSHSTGIFEIPDLVKSL